MTTTQLADGAVSVEASLIATDLGLDPSQVLDSMRTGRLTATCEQGVNEDAGRYRLTFFHANRRLQLIVDEDGRVLERAAADRHPRRARARAKGANTPQAKRS